ncbi:DNA repair protein RecO [Tenacibaculum sp. M341]|uniref:DNA repair protein RecO n=1 Tax=Tenacibaculum sp. M341 TaxID=2530339 RepID=UPI00104AA6F4|nr:DNA repair protein RecO [Tenacibaculum sp. M341]TCI84623.1 DNA repair protein RecO [Tenacibaculum sp. M341]
MAVVTTKTIVLNAIKYSDTSLIVKCLTQKEGVKSYMLRGILKSRKGKLKSAYFQPLTQLEITASHTNKNTLNSIKEARVIYPYSSVPTSIVKQSIVLFLSEILTNIIQEEEENEQLYNYIEASLIWLDTHNSISNFHLLFLLNLSRYLGFYPDVSDSDKSGFNLLEGKFTFSSNDKLTITDKNLTLFKRLLGTNFDAIHTLSFQSKERQIILKIIIQYFELHLDGFRKPKSLAILETVFN